MPEHEELQVLCAPRKGAGRSRGRAIAAGALNFLKIWPGPARSDLLGAVLAGCLLSATFVVLALVPAILALAPHANDTCRHHRRSAVGYNNGKSTNVYFVKHENRTWTNEEFCSMETAAHRYPQYNIFIINLLSKEILVNESDSYAKYFDEIVEECITSKKKITTILNKSNSSEAKLRYKLSQIPNVKNIDISIDRFFARSIMSKKIKRLNSYEIELAAKFQVIWDSSGIALEPLIIHQLESVRRFMNKNKIDIVANIQVDNDLQATSVPCQSFIGFVISQMAKSSFTDRQSLLKHVLMDFCSSSVECPGVRIVKPISKSLLNLMSCPIILPFINANNESNGNHVISSNK